MYYLITKPTYNCIFFIRGTFQESLESHIGFYGYNTPENSVLERNHWISIFTDVLVYIFDHYNYSK